MGGGAAQLANPFIKQLHLFGATTVNLSPIPIPHDVLVSSACARNGVLFFIMRILTTIGVLSK